MASSNRYLQIIARIFDRLYSPGATNVAFKREDIETAAKELGIGIPKNIGDVIYSFRYRTSLPAVMRDTAPKGYEWIIRPGGRASYQFALVPQVSITPSPLLIETKIPDATPGVIQLYSLNDEQALLARVRYNRLIDIFTSLTCYSLQNHLRTTVPELGQVETDELYIGLNQAGAHYVIPVQAKAGTDRIGVIQIEQDFAVCASKFPGLICRPVAAQFMLDDLIALFEFVQTEQGIRIAAEKHYRLVMPQDLSPEELASYREISG